MKKKLLFLFLLFLIAFGLTCCSSDDSKASSGTNNSSQSERSDSSTALDLQNRKIYYSVDFQLDCYRDIDGGIQKVNSLVKEYGGYSTNEKLEKNTNREYTQATIYYRVPTNKVIEFCEKLEGRVTVVKKSLETHDVTDQYISNEASIEVLKARKAVFEEELEAATTADARYQIILKIDDIEKDIKTLEKAQDVLQNEIEYSSVTVVFVGTVEKPFFKQYFGFVGDFFKTIGKIILYLLPFGVIAGGIYGIVILVKFLKRRKKLKVIDVNTKKE